MNSKIFKPRSRFSLVKTASNTSAKNLINVYQTTERCFFFHCVKTKLDFVSFTPIVPVSSSISSMLAVEKVMSKPNTNNYIIDLLTIIQIFSSLFVEKQVLTNKKFNTPFVIKNTKSILPFKKVTQEKKRNYINAKFFYIRSVFEINCIYVNAFTKIDKVYQHPFFQKGLGFISFAASPLTREVFRYPAKLNRFNNFSRNLKFNYTYYAYALKKNTLEALTFFNDSFVACLPNNHKNKYYSSFTIHPFKISKINSIPVYLTQYTPKKKRKFVVKRKRWKRKVAFSAFFKKCTKTISLLRSNKFKKISLKNRKSRKGGTQFLAKTKKYNVIQIKKTKKRKNKFALSRLLYSYLFSAQSVRSSKQNFIERSHKINSQRVLIKKIGNVYFNAAIKKRKQIKKINTKLFSRPNNEYTHKIYRKIKRFTVKHAAFSIKHPVYAYTAHTTYTSKDRLRRVNGKSKAFTHKNALLQFSDSENTLQKNAPSRQHQFIENFLRRSLGTKVSLFRINALSFTRYSFNNALKEKQFEDNKKKKSATEKRKSRTWQNYRSFLNRKKAKKRRKVVIASSRAAKSAQDPLALSHVRANSNVTNVSTKQIIKKPFNKQKKQNYISKKGRKNSSIFRKALEKERTLRYRYTAVYIKDFLRLTFIGFYYKHPQLIREFAAFILKKLPRNRKETKYLRFIIKVRKVFAAQREEVVGIRLRFQGRINRWRRTKHIVGRKGIFPLHTFDTYIAYGRAQAMTRKGAFGRRLWIAYLPFFGKIYRNNFYTYITSSKPIAQ